jgi:Tol biopolymer transport system component
LSPHLSSTGTRIVFATAAPDLVAGDTNAVSDVFMRDLATATTTRISVDNFGEQTGAASGLRPRISGNGRYIAFSNGASLDGTGTSGVYVTDTVGGTVTRVERGDDLDIDDSGRYVAAAQSFQQRFVDRIVGETVDLPDGYLPSLSANGEYTAYRSVSDRVVAWSRATGALEIARERTGTVVPVNPLRRTEISGDGRWVAFATSVWPGDEGRQVVVRVLNLAAVP